eukprot:13805440-Alexandrium_andersonii.AAC.1
MDAQLVSGLPMPEKAVLNWIERPSRRSKSSARVMRSWSTIFSSACSAHAIACCRFSAFPSGIGNSRTARNRLEILHGPWLQAMPGYPGLPGGKQMGRNLRQQVASKA